MDIKIGAIYICDQTPPCHNDNMACGTLCKRTSMSEQAKHKDSVDIYEKFINRFDVNIGSDGKVMMVEREIPYS